MISGRHVAPGCALSCRPFLARIPSSSSSSISSHLIASLTEEVSENYYSILQEEDVTLANAMLLPADQLLLGIRS
jgi:hypothetical protein